MKELLETIAMALVDEPSQVVVTSKVEETTVSLELKVAKEDMGKVIGRQGRIAKAIRTLMKAAAVKEEKRVNVEIIQ